MKRLLNSLYVTTQGAYLSRDGEAVVVRADGETKLHIPIHTLESIVCFGQVMCTPPLMGLCGERGVAISFLSEHGRFMSRMQGPTTGNVLVRREQYRKADSPDESSTIARAIVIAKVANSRTVLLRQLRDHPGSSGGTEVQEAAGHLAQVLRRLRQPIPLDLVRGHEGEAAHVYFSVFDHLITAQKDGFKFVERNRRPPLDPMNALLSFLYALVTHDVASALESVGLDPAVGYLHRDRPGRPGLALDMVEELRPVLADRTALSLVNRQQVTARGFKVTETGAVVMDDETRKEVLKAYQKRKQDEIVHPFLDEKIAMGLVPFAQALLMGRYLRGDLDAYPPFLWR